MTDVLAEDRLATGLVRNAPAAEDRFSGDSPIRVLIVEDEYTLRETCVSVLTHDGFEVVGCSSAEEALELVARRPFDLLLVDVGLPGMGGMELLRRCVERRPETLAMVMTGNPSLDSSMEALATGAWEYLPKPFSAPHLQILCGRAAHSIRKNRQAAVEPDDRSRKPSGADRLGMIGRAPAFLAALELARRVAVTSAHVFLTGESGTGKEMFAHFIHNQSRRTNRSLVAVNCAALPEPLLESEMFGHVKGAFTGAIRDKMGLLETANGGTFFLDELTEMPLLIQAKLLRVIQDGVVRRVGSESVDATVNVRFVAASNRDAWEAIGQGSLRKDLFYRLSVVPIRLPPLRDRLEDIGPLAEQFLAHYWKRHRERGAPVPRLGPSALRELQARPWSGNVRELQNVIEHAVVLLEPGAEISAGDLPSGEAEGGGSSGMRMQRDWRAHTEFNDQGYHAERDRMMAEFELAYLSWLVDRAGANMSRAAKIAGVDRTTLYRLMEKHRLHRESSITSDGALAMPMRA